MGFQRNRTEDMHSTGTSKVHMHTCTSDINNINDYWGVIFTGRPESGPHWCSLQASRHNTRLRKALTRQTITLADQGRTIAAITNNSSKAVRIPRSNNRTTCPNTWRNYACCPDAMWLKTSSQSVLAVSLGEEKEKKKKRRKKSRRGVETAPVCKRRGGERWAERGTRGRGVGWRITCFLASCAVVSREESREAEPEERAWPCECVASAHSSAGKACQSQHNPPITTLVNASSTPSPFQEEIRQRKQTPLGCLH